jgi:hypothetical protein
MSFTPCFGPAGRCQMTAPCEHACALRVQPADAESPTYSHGPLFEHGWDGGVDESRLRELAREDYENFYHKVRADIGFDDWFRAWRKGYRRGKAAA